MVIIMGYFDVLIEQYQEIDSNKECYNFLGKMSITQNVYTIWIIKNNIKIKYLQLVFADNIIHATFQNQTKITLIKNELVTADYIIDGYKLNLEIELISYSKSETDLSLEYNLFNKGVLITRNLLKITKK